MFRRPRCSFSFPASESSHLIVGTRISLLSLWRQNTRTLFVSLVFAIAISSSPETFSLLAARILSPPSFRSPPPPHSPFVYLPGLLPRLPLFFSPPPRSRLAAALFPRFSRLTGNTILANNTAPRKWRFVSAFSSVLGAPLLDTGNGAPVVFGGGSSTFAIAHTPTVHARGSVEEAA